MSALTRVVSGIMGHKEKHRADPCPPGAGDICEVLPTMGGGGLVGDVTGWFLVNM